jgi:hypothetical protein
MMGSIAGKKGKPSPASSSTRTEFFSVAFTEEVVTARRMERRKHLLVMMMSKSLEYGNESKLFQIDCFLMYELALERPKLHLAEAKDYLKIHCLWAFLFMSVRVYSCLVYCSWIGAQSLSKNG